MQPAALVDSLNADYVRLHTSKEDAFWAAYMGHRADKDAARADLDAREVELQRFLRDPARLAEVKAALAEAQRSRAAADVVTALEGWVATFGAHVIDSAEARALAEEVVAAEGALAKARGSMKLGYVDPGPQGQASGFVEASSVKLAVMLRSETDPRRREAAWRGLRSIEPHVLANGFLEVVKLRNRLGRTLGAEDYYDWKVRRVEGMSKAQVFALLDDLEARTRDAGRRAIEGLKARTTEPVTAWNIRFLATGDVTRDLDPHFPFAEAVRRWGRSFAALGIAYRDATLVLDLLDRKGKYENGFMHGPEVSWRRHGRALPARIHFTANAIPSMTGSGQSATATLFHEGGHAAHFANVDMPAPCFGQEFAPTSVAFAETQSMFLDSLLEDGDWLARYARTRDGAAMPWALVEKAVRAKQPFAAWDLRQMLTVCYGEKAIYELPESQLTPDGVLAALREVEQRLLFLDDGSPRPVLAVPHLLSGESSAYYHGYVLAEMGVHQTRDFFLRRDGALTDNPRLGPDLAKAYWQPGNSRGCSTLIQALCGQPLGADALAKDVSRTVDEALKDARAAYDRGAAAGAPASKKIDLHARVKVVHGLETVAELAPGGDFEAFADAFATWADRQAAAKS